jgi:hypothetical protein
MRNGGNMKKIYVAIISVAAIALMCCGTADASIAYDADVTPDVIFGSGNSNGFFCC